MQNEAHLIFGNGADSWNILMEKLNCSKAVSPIDCARITDVTTIKDIIAPLDFTPSMTERLTAKTCSHYFHPVLRPTCHVPFVISYISNEFPSNLIGNVTTILQGLQTSLGLGVDLTPLLKAIVSAVAPIYTGSAQVPAS